MSPDERMTLALVLLILAAAVLLRGSAHDDFMGAEHRRAAVEDCRARRGMAVPTLDGPIACIDSATVVALPAEAR